MIEITDKAKDELRRMLGGYTLEEGQAFRLATPPVWEGAGDFGIVIDVGRDRDHVVEHEGVELLRHRSRRRRAPGQGRDGLQGVALYPRRLLRVLREVTVSPRLNKRGYMRYASTALAAFGLLLALAFTGCLEGSESGEHDEGSESGEHAEGSESGEHDDGEESRNPVRPGRDIRRGPGRCSAGLSYDSDANAFTGTVENTTGDTLRRVRVEVHLSNGIELGPTTPVDLAPGQMTEVTLPATSQPFISWSAHPEVD